MMFYKTLQHKKGRQKQFALLVDPGKLDQQALERTMKTADIADVDFFLLGGSLISVNIDDTIGFIKKFTSKPVILFPGSLLQISGMADGLLLLSLISGRNPEYLIGNHVIAAPYLKKSSLEVISTGYILIESGRTSSVEYISNTRAIPADKKDLIIATALAGEMLGMKCIYLEGGSGANSSIPSDIIRAVRQNITVPLIIGGGIQTKTDVERIYKAGADIVVVGNAIENDYELSIELAGVNRFF